jgi:hypothetical protein
MPTLEVAKASVAELYGNAARLVREREAAIHQSFNDIADQVRKTGADRAQRAGNEQQAEAAGMQSAAQNLGIQAPPTAGRGTASFRAVDAAENEGNTEGWVEWLANNRNLAAGRNMAQSHAFDYLGSKRIQELEQDYLASLSGGGGGYGRGGGDDSSSDGTVYPSRVAQLDPGVARGLAATQIRLTKQGAVMPKDYTYSVARNSNPAIRAAESKQSSSLLRKS